MITIDLIEWNITYTEFTKWCIDTGAKVYAVTSSGSSTKYMFEEADLLAFKITFAKGKSLLTGYKGITTVDSAMYYCPYIPIFK